MAKKQIEIGISNKERKQITDGLSALLADSYMLYIKTHNFHWNVEGPMFNTLHTMFMDQYTELWNALDTLAERIRALGEYAPGSYKQFAALTSIEESDKVPKAEKMIQELIKGHETVIQTARKLLPICDDAHDDVTAGVLTDRLEIHEKTSWMLRSLLAK
ncbi:MAG: DNA starvation/stationary phase protection protein [Pseudobdellovibrio sp.]|nr:DNA starvation/stationary phase protection protein [Pseudobdellovibrio sp.]